MNPNYQPPTADEIARAQNRDSNLQLLLAQRKMYSSAKRWASVRYVGVLVVAIAAPILAAIRPDSAVPAATIAAIWYVLNNMLFKYLEKRGAARAASVQEQFDLNVFGMPMITVREPRVLPEDIALLTRPVRNKQYAIEKLRDWYPIETGTPGRVAIAIAQRANAAYMRRLLLWSSSLGLALITAWAVIAIVIGVSADFRMATFLLVIAIPVLPPLMDAWEEFVRVGMAGREREALANEIQDAIDKDRHDNIRPEQLLAWQSQLFSLRRDAPLVPDWLYGWLRERNEREMLEAAKAIANRASTEVKE